MFNSLFGRFGLILAVMLLAWGALRTNPIKLGTDLQGGVDLVYELDMSKLAPGADPATTAAKVIDVLKKRVDPAGVMNLTWRVVGGKRIEIQMPLANPETRAARKELNDAKDALRATNLSEAVINTVLSRSGAERQAAIDLKVPKDDLRRPMLEDLAKASDEKNAAAAKLDEEIKGKGPSAQTIAAASVAEAKFDAAHAAVIASNVDVERLEELLVATGDPSSVNTKAQDELKKLEADHVAVAKQIATMKAAWTKVQDSHGGGFDDPADLQRLLKGAGVLDFRIAVQPGSGMEASIAQAKEQLDAVGPRKVNVPNVAWFTVDPANGESLLKGDFVTRRYNGKDYILLYNDVGHSLTHDKSMRPADWKLTGANVGRDPTSGMAIVDFDFDGYGSAYFGRMTGDNIGHPMAILLDDKALQAPYIRSTITSRGQISFGDGGGTRSAKQVLEEAKNLVEMLDAGSLPATLQTEPISVQTISPSFGADNIRAGKQSGIYAVLAVMVFMLVYYTLTGTFANVGLMINLLLLMAAMAMSGATLTLPGIAGIVLTLGMAVDANVLINERIREEVHRGASLWMAVKLGYDKVFWTIFDANTTTSLTSIVLIFVASEEVKGFGVTLLIGLMVHMFTALFVTRTLMIAAIKWGILRKIDDKSIAEYIRDIVTLTWLRKGQWPFMRVITVSNIDWIGMRHIFWGVSAVVTVGGVVAFLARGNDKYDTEFNGGTMVTFELKPGVTMKVDDVRARVGDIAQGLIKGSDRVRQDEGRELEQATIIQIGDKGDTFQIVTTIADTETVKVKSDFLDRLTTKFSDVLDVKPKLAFKDANVSKDKLDDLLADGTVRDISKRFLDQVIPGIKVQDLAQNDIGDFVGGTAIVLDDISPPQRVKDIEERIKSMRQQPDRKEVPYRETRVIPITFAPSNAAGTQPGAAEGEGRLVTKAVIISVDPNLLYGPDTVEAWKTKVASTEWDIVDSALTTASSLRGVSSFDPVVASAAKQQALIAIGLSLALIIVYVWVRFGGIRYGVGAILSLVHDAMVALAATVLSGVFAQHFPKVAHALLITDFKINLTMIAAYLTIIGYSVNDTIVIFDRIRENRGRAHVPLSMKLVNDSINQCFGRTIWTTFTVFIVVLIMYIWGGEGVRGFSFAMLIGVFTGAYSTLAIASPALLSVKETHKPAVTRFEITKTEG